jgi:hypothetical protein
MTNPKTNMNQLLHQELINLQTNLQELQTAKSQIEMVSEAAQKVVVSVAEIQQQYTTFLPQLLADLTAHNQQALTVLQTENKEIVQQTALDLVETNKQIADKYAQQYQQIQSYLAQYEVVTNLIANLQGEIQQINFPQRFESLETVVQAIHAAVEQDIAELRQVKQHNDEHLAAIQQAHQYYLSNFFEKSESNFASANKDTKQQIDTIIQDFRVLQQETALVFEQQKQNFRVTLQEVEQQTSATLKTVGQTTETSAKQIVNVGLQMQQNLTTQLLEIQQFVNAYQGLIDYTKAVENKIADINFPQKLSNIGTQLSVLEGKIEEQLIETQASVKTSMAQQFGEIDLKLNLQRKQSENYFQLLENQQQRILAQNEQAQRHLQLHITETQETANTNLKLQNQLLQSQLTNQSKQLQYLLFALVSLGIFSIVHLLWSLFKG